MYSGKIESYYKSSFSIMNKKREKDYYKIFKILGYSIKSYLYLGESYNINEVHTDLEYSKWM